MAHHSNKAVLLLASRVASQPSCTTLLIHVSTIIKYIFFILTGPDGQGFWGVFFTLTVSTITTTTKLLIREDIIRRTSPSHLLNNVW